MPSDTEDDPPKQGGSNVTPLTRRTLLQSPDSSLAMDTPVVLTGLELHAALSNALKEHGLPSVGDTARAVQGKFKKIPKRKHSELITKSATAECFASASMCLSQDTICRVLNCKDPMHPETKDDAIAIAKCCLYGSIKIPHSVEEKAGEVTLDHRYVYSCLPITENKERCVEYGKKRDTLFQLGYDEKLLKPKGGVSSSYDLHFNQAMAEKMYFSFSQGREDAGQSETIARQWTYIQGLAREDFLKSEALLTALNEEAKLRTLLERVHANPDKDFLIPKRHKHLENARKCIRSGRFKSWTLMPLDVTDDGDDSPRKKAATKSPGKTDATEEEKSSESDDDKTEV